MKLICFLLFWFTNDINPTKGQVHLELTGEMLLRFVYHPNYNYYEKSCCKFTSNGCIIFVTSNGYVHNAYKGRIETYKYSGTFDVRIWNVHVMDAGIYRCEIREAQKYQDFQVVFERKTELNPILAFPKTTISPVSSALNLLEKHQEISSAKWSLKFTLGTIFGGLIIILIMSVSLTVVYFKKKSRGKCCRSFPSAPSVIQQLPQELIYTTVDFKVHQKTSNIYANLDIQASGPGSGNALKAQDTVEYATIAAVL